VALKAALRSYLQPDPYSDPAKGFEYAVHSLYLDSPSLALCRAAMRGHKNRFKLRIRFYDESPDGVAFLEVKRRLNDVIVKQRVAVRRAAVHRVLSGHWPSRADLLDHSLRSQGAVQAFCSLRTRIHAEGQVVVSYMREAYVGPGNTNLRLTFDRRLRGTPYAGNGLLTARGAAVFPAIDGVILELKFTDKFPLRLTKRIFSL
jgi:SPX domain protein involved in polyphosphate accumulation